MTSFARHYAGKHNGRPVLSAAPPGYVRGPIIGLKEPIVSKPQAEEEQEKVVMGITKIVLEKSLLVNTEKYENVRIEARIEYTVEDGETTAEARKAAREALTDALLDELTPVMDAAMMSPERRRRFLQSIGVEVGTLAASTDDLPF